MQCLGPCLAAPLDEVASTAGLVEVVGAVGLDEATGASGASGEGGAFPSADFNETMVKPTTIRMILTIALSKN